MPRLSFYPIADSYLLVAVVALVLVGSLFLGPRGGQLTVGRRRALLALRIVVVLLLIVAMLRPTIVRTETQIKAATVAILVDTSRSMSVPDALGGRKSRYEALRQALDNAQESLAELADRYEVKVYAFNSETAPVEMTDGAPQLPDVPEGNETALGAALDDVLRFEAGKRLLSIVLMSDGAQRAYAPRDIAPQTTATALRRLGCPLLTVPFGQSRGLGQAKDVAVHQLLVDENVFAKNEMNVTAEIRTHGFVNRELPVRLLFELTPGTMTVVAQETIKPTVEGQIIPISLSYVPEMPGQYKVTIDVPEQPGELVTTNNQMSTFVNVLAGGLNVLYLEGSPPRVDTKFLRRALDASVDIHVDYLSFRKATRPSDLDERFKPGAYMVYILGDLPADAFTTEQLRLLAEAVDRGAGLIMLGGFHTFGPGGYADTPLADVLPIRMSPLERLMPGQPPAADMNLSGTVHMQPSRFGADHFALMLSGDRKKNAELWNQLPPLDGANRFARNRIKRGAVVLAVDQNDNPLLVEQTYGAGRVLAFAGDTTWRWVMMPGRNFNEQHQRFWRQIVLWLAKKDELSENDVWIRLAQRRIEPSGQIEVTAGVNGPDRRPIDDATVTAEVTLPDGAARPLRLARQGDDWTGSFSDTREAGDYLVTVRAQATGRVLGQTKGRFLVFEEDLELDNASADTGAMESLAAMAKGRTIAAEQLSKQFEELARQTDQLEEKTEIKRTYWDTWPFLLLFVALMSLDWYLRKRWGLV